MELSLNAARSIVGRDPSEFTSGARNGHALRLAVADMVEASASPGPHALRRLGERSVEGRTQVFGELVGRGIVPEEAGLAVMRSARPGNLVARGCREVDDFGIYGEAKGSGLKVVGRFVEEVGRHALGARG